MIPQSYLPGLGPDPPRREPGPPCLRCEHDTVVRPGTPPHFRRADCLKCGAWRWLPKPHPRRGEGRRPR
jgi:hypothetical protein